LDYIYLVEEKVKMADGIRSWCCCISYESPEEAFKRMQAAINDEDPNILWKYSFEHCKNGREIQITGKGCFVWEDLENFATYEPEPEPGEMTLTLTKIRFIRAKPDDC